MLIDDAKKEEQRKNNLTRRVIERSMQACLLDQEMCLLINVNVLWSANENRMFDTWLDRRAMDVSKKVAKVSSSVSSVGCIRFSLSLVENRIDSGREKKQRASWKSWLKEKEKSTFILFWAIEKEKREMFDEMENATRSFNKSFIRISSMCL